MSDDPLPYATRELAGSLYWDERGVVLDAEPRGPLAGDAWLAPGLGVKRFPWHEIAYLSAGFVWPDVVIEHRVRGLSPQRYVADLSATTTFLAPFEASVARAWDAHVEGFFEAALIRLPRVVEERGWRAAPARDAEPIDRLPEEASPTRRGPYREALVSTEKILWTWSAPRIPDRGAAYARGLVRPARLLLGDTHVFAEARGVKLRFPRHTFRGFVEARRGEIVEVHRWLFGRHSFLSLGRQVSEALLNAMGLEPPRLPREQAKITRHER